MTAETRRERLLISAPKLFASLGYEATSLQDLADGVGCGRSSVLHDFGSKEALLAAIADPFLETVKAMLATVDLDLGRDEDSRTILRAYVQLLCENRDVGRVLITDPAARRTPIGQLVVEQQRLVVARLTGPRASLRRQVRARCALAICHLIVGDLAGVQAHRLRSPILEAAYEMYVPADVGPEPGVRPGIPRSATLQTPGRWTI